MKYNFVKGESDIDFHMQKCVKIALVGGGIFNNDVLK